MRMRAFGLDVSADFPIAGAAASPHLADGRGLSLRLAELGDARRELGEEFERLGSVQAEDGEVVASVDAADRGYLLYAAGFGHALVSPSGREAVVSPLAEPAWVWQRFLTGQVMPMAALLQGLEVFHASVMGLDGRAIGVVAPSGIGKTTIALHLALKGLAFMSDDVLLLEPSAEGVRAHPAIGLANVRAPSRALLPELASAGLGAPVGESEHETRIALRSCDQAVPLGALFVLTRFSDARELKVERLAPVDPRILLAATFNLSVRTPERLERQLDICARMAQSAPVFRVTCGTEVTAAEVADAILGASSPNP